MTDRRRASDYDRDSNDAYNSGRDYGSSGSERRYTRRDAYSSGDGYGYDSNPYAAQSDRYDRSRYAAGTDRYAAQQRPERRSTADSYRDRSSADSRQRRSRGAEGTQSQDRRQATQYPVGAGQAYTSSRRPNNATGVAPVTAHPYRTSGNNLTPQNNDRKEISRRGLLKAAGIGIAAASLLGFVGVAWYTHRAVACTINGNVREVPVNSSAQDIINRGFASPQYGNLVSICEEGETPQLIEKGSGNPYMLIVNGEPVDTESFRLREGDVVEFINGTDVTEDVYEQTTEIPCGIQIPDSSLLLATVGYVKQWGCSGISTIETGVRSGKTVDRGITREPQDFIIANTGVNPDDGRLLVALTFDDGPSPTYTPQYLDILSAYGAKATFFNLGMNVDEGSEYQALCQRVVNEGHQLASHTYSHDDATLSGLDASTREWEISHAFESIKNATGVDTNVFRPPYGEFRGWQYLQYMKDTGLDIAYSAYWSVDSLDWELPGVDSIIEACTKGLSGDNYNGAIILMHDGGGDRSQDVAALPTIIERFQSNGYQLVTLDELLAADSTIPEWVSSGKAKRPDGWVMPDTSAFF